MEKRLSEECMNSIDIGRAHTPLTKERTKKNSARNTYIIKANISYNIFLCIIL